MKEIREDNPGAKIQLLLTNPRNSGSKLVISQEKWYQLSK